MRRSVALLIASVLLAVACGQTVSPQPSAVNLPSTSLPPAWYFVQWEGYSAGLEGDSVPVVLSFISLQGPPADNMGEITLLTDKGDLPTKIQSIDPSPKEQAYQFFSVLLAAENLKLGIYHFDQVRIRTGSAAAKTYSVGSWEMEVAPRPLDTVLKLNGTTVGGTELSAIEITLENTATADRVAIEGLQAHLPQRGVTFALHGGSPDVTIDAGKAADLTFEVTAAAPTPAFVYVKPLLRYRVGDGAGTRLFALEGHVYAPGFTSDEELGLFLRTLPKSAHGE